MVYNNPGKAGSHLLVDYKSTDASFLLKKKCSPNIILYLSFSELFCQTNLKDQFLTLQLANRLGFTF